MRPIASCSMQWLELSGTEKGPEAGPQIIHVSYLGIYIYTFPNMRFGVLLSDGRLQQRIDWELKMEILLVKEKS